MALSVSALVFLGLMSPLAAYAACTTPAGDAGDQFFNTTVTRMQYCDGTNWINMGVSAGASADNLGDHIATTVLRSDTHNTDDLGTTAIRWKDGWFAGAVTAGSFAGVGTNLTTLNASNLGSGTVPTARLGSGTANATTYLRGDGQWVAVSSGLPALNSALMWVGNGSNVATAVAMSGDATLANTGALTIAASAVGSSEITDNSIAAVDIAPDAITASELATSAVAAAEILDASIVATTELSATGTKTSATFLRGDNTWSSTIVGNLTATAYLHSSDERLKTDIETISDPLALLGQLRGVHYKWKADEKPAYGFIAQEVERIIPDAVGTDDKGMKAVEYDQIIAPLVEAVKAQQQQIEALQKDVRALRGAGE